ncbi:MAG: hypothetical protein WAW16_02970, partial [Candidatus Cryosericum sp.]
MTKQTDVMLHESPRNRRVATAATAEVSDLRNPTAKATTVGVSHDGRTISVTFDDTLTGGRTPHKLPSHGTRVLGRTSSGLLPAVSRMARGASISRAAELSGSESYDTPVK